MGGFGSLTPAQAQAVREAELRKAALRRSEMAADALRAKAAEQYPALSGANTPPEPDGTFLSRRLGDAETAAVAGPPPDDVGVVQAPAPEADPFAAAATGGMGYGGALKQAQLMDASQRTVRQANPMYEPTRALGREQQRLGLEEIEGTEAAYATQAAMARDRAVLANEAHQAQAQIAAREQFVAAQQARRRQDVEESLAKYTALADKAAEEFQRAEKYEPGSAFAGKSTAAQIGIVLAAIGRGMRGGNPSDIFSEIQQRELAAHKQMRSDARERLGAARGRVANAKNLRDQYLALSGDERVADALTNKSTLQAIQAKMGAMVAQYGPRIVNDQWREAEVALERKLAEADFMIAQREAASPKYFHRQVSTMGAAERRIRRDMAGQMVDSAGDAAKQGLSARAAKNKAAATDEHGLTDRDWRQIEKYGSDSETAKLEGIVRQIDEITAPEDIRGLGPVGKDWIGTDGETRDYAQQVRLLEESIGRAQSGGAITEEEGTRFREMLEAGVAWGGGESRFRENLAAVRRMMSSRLETKRRSLSPAAQRYITRGQQATDYTREHHDAGHGRKRVQAADGSITVNRSEFE